MPWSKLSGTGLDLSSQAAFGPHKLPPDWLAITADSLKPARGFATVFGHDAIRIPLYLIWAGKNDHILVQRLAALWNKPAAFSKIELATGISLWRFSEPGYAAIKRLVDAAVGERCPSAILDETSAGQVYYSATLALLALVASEALRVQRHDRCSNVNRVTGQS